MYFVMEGKKYSVQLLRAKTRIDRIVAGLPLPY